MLSREKRARFFDHIVYVAKPHIADQAVTSTIDDLLELILDLQQRLSQLEQKNST